MSKIDLTLIPLDDLLKEAEGRCSSFVAAYELPKDENKNTDFYYGKGVYFDAVRLASLLNNFVLNDWEGETRFLRRLNKDEKR